MDARKQSSRDRIQGMKQVKRRRTSGTTWTEADYRAAGYGTIKLRLPLATLEMLTTKSDETERTRADLVDEMIRKGNRRAEFVRLAESMGEPPVSLLAGSPSGELESEIEWHMARLIPLGSDAVKVHLTRSLVHEAMSICHECGTPEATRAFVIDTIRETVAVWARTLGVTR